MQFLVDGKEAGDPVPLVKGQATWTTADLEPGEHQVTAVYTADKNGVYLDSSSFEVTHTIDK